MTRNELAYVIVWGMVIDGIDGPGVYAALDLDSWRGLIARAEAVQAQVETVLRRAGVPETVELTP